MIGKVKVVLISVMMLMVHSSAADAASFTGRKLLDALSDPAAAVRTFAEGYVFGIADSMQEAYPVFGLFRACIPTEMSPGKVAAIVKETLQQQTGYLHNSAGFLVAKALADAFPCWKDAR